MYFPGDIAGYNRALLSERLSVVSLQLEQLKALHTDSYGWALACCAWQRELAEDVLQEAYLRVLDGRADFSGTATLKTWFFAVIKRVAADLLRTQKRRSVLNLQLVSDAVEPAQAVSGEDNTMTEALHKDHTSHKLQNALLQLSPRQKDILHLVFYSGLSLEEAATTVQITVGSARTHYHRGKERLHQILKENDADAH